MAGRRGTGNRNDYGHAPAHPAPPIAHTHLRGVQYLGDVAHGRADIGVVGGGSGHKAGGAREVFLIDAAGMSGRGSEGGACVCRMRANLQGIMAGLEVYWGS